MNHILVMLLSTFNSTEVKQSVAIGEDGKKYRYFHQMEPVPQMLQDKGELNTIVALCTKETFENKALIINGEMVNTSEVQYFQNKFSEFDTKFVLVDPDDPARGIVEATHIIRDLYSKSECRLWVDIHGGFRALQTTFQVVISILEKEGISSEKNYSVKGKAGEFHIVEESQCFDINYLYSGMNEFFNTGKANMLKKFMESKPANKQNIELVSIIKMISDAILLCDMDAFDAGCDRMDNWLKQRKNDGSYIDIFVEYFKADYGPLLEKKKGIISKIEWCLNKDYLQQALTLIESKMPEKIYNTYIICTDLDKTVKMQDGKTTIEELVKKTKIKFESRESFFVREYAYYIIAEEDINRYTNLRDVNIIRNMVAKEIKNPKPIPNLQDFFIIEDKKNIENRKRKKNIDKIGAKVTFKYMKPAETQSMFALFMKLHMALKDQRNSVAHSSSGKNKERIKASQVKAAIEAYIELAKVLEIY